MTKTLEAVFDGEVFRPESPPDLEPNQKYKLTIDRVVEDVRTTGNAWDVLERLAGTLEMPEDWAEEHNHYLYGTPKQAGKTPS